MKHTATGRLRDAGALFAFTLFVVLAAALAGCGGSHAPARHHVVIQGFRFQPDSLVVAAGDTVEWSNRDILPHTSTAADSAWDSGVLAVGASWSTVLGVPGSHAYVCRLHPTMKARVQVR